MSETLKDIEISVKRKGPLNIGALCGVLYDTHFTRLDWRNDTPATGADNGDRTRNSSLVKTCVLPITTISAPHGNNYTYDLNEIKNFWKL